MSLIPTIKIVPSGDKGACQSYIKFATAQLSILERQMSFQKLNEGSRIVSPMKGVTVECISKFGKKEVRIHVDQDYAISKQPKEIITPKKQDILEPLIEENPVYYFVRIKSPDPESYPQDLDGWVGSSYPEIYMDRIILCDLAFDGNVNEIDPLLTNTANRGSNFTPGGGAVAFDVDILNGVVYFPIVETEDERIAIVNKITTMAQSLPTNEIPNPPGVLRDIALETFGFGRMSDPIMNADKGGYATPAVNTVYDIAYIYSVEDSAWSSMVDQFARDEPENDDNANFLSVWQTAWSPKSGGNTDTYLAQYSFDGLDSVKEYYGEFSYDTGILTNTVLYTFLYIYHLGNFDLDIILVHNRSYPGERNRQIIDGMFFTPSDNRTTSPPLFCLFSGSDAKHIDARIFDGKIVDGVASDYGLIGVTMGTLLADFGESLHNATISGITSPLEEISVLELLMENTSSDNEPPCSEAPCWFSISDTLYVYWFYVDTFSYNGVVYNVGSHILQELVPCPLVPKNLFYDLGAITKATTSYDTHRLCNFHIVNPSTPKGQENFASFFVFHELRELRQQGICQDYNDGPLYPTDPCLCNGKTTTRADMPISPHTAAGVAIYIFAPEELYTVNPATGVSDLTWDIHTARRDQGIINPYRNLVLEEYVNTVLTDIQTTLDNATTIPKLTDTMAFTMNYYGFGITDGFAMKE